MDKTQNTIKNKAKFASLYKGCKIIIPDTPKYHSYPFDKNEGGLLLDGVLGDQLIILRIAEQVRDTQNQAVLSLTPLSQIADEDAIEVAKIFNIGHLKGTTITLIKSILSALDGSTPKSETTEFVLNWLTAQDFLRSRGYALPWMGKLVENLIEYGWIKLKEV